MAKKYLLKIDSKVGATLEICANTDNAKPIFIYYCGRDTGKRYVNIGSAARYLEKVAAMWGDKTVKEYRTADTMPILGCSEWNKKQFCRDYGINTKMTF